jgi:membrane-bound lytic murein transglycosylase A
MHSYVPVSFAAIPGWDNDDHLAAFDTFRKSCARLTRRPPAGTAPSPPPAATSREAIVERLRAICTAATELARGKVRSREARAFFETYFTPHRVAHGATEGMVTGYYEPVLRGARTPRGGFTTPIYRRPPDLVNVVDETERGAKAHALTHVRLTAEGKQVPYPTRHEIEDGALAGQDLELLYLADAVDVFFMQVQGSGRIALDDGTSVRVTYDGKNGHPYTSVGRYLIDSGAFTSEQVSLQSLERWLKADPVRGQQAMRQNKSYVFFREVAAEEADGPLGALAIPLTAGRSLAVDTAFHALGLPVWVSAPTLRHATPSGGFQRLMIAQDVGSAIRGPERGDIYFGSGDAAGKLAGVTKHAANFVVLLPSGAPGEGTPTKPRTAGQR